MGVKRAMEATIQVSKKQAKMQVSSCLRISSGANSIVVLLLLDFRAREDRIHLRHKLVNRSLKEFQGDNLDQFFLKYENFYFI